MSYSRETTALEIYFSILLMALIALSHEIEFIEKAVK